MALSGITVLPSLMIGVTSTGSHWMGACESQYAPAILVVIGKTHLGSGENILDGLRDLRSDAITLD